MLSRIITAAAILLCATLPASALGTKPADEALATAASRMKVKDYTGAREAAVRSNEKGARAFLLGMAAVKLDLWEEAATQLAVAVESYPILADYAMYYQGLALSKLGRADQALTPLYNLLKQYPESRLVRAALALYGDTLAAGGHYKEALETYTTFIERYPSGSDSVSASYGSGICRARLGEPAAAAGIFRIIWLNYPGSPLAEKAAAELQTLAAAGTAVEPYSTAELFKRAGVLYDLGRYAKAAEAYAALTVNGDKDDFNCKLRLKMGQALFKARRYREAQAAFQEVVEKATGNNASEGRYWLGRALDKAGKGEEAYDLFVRLADPDKGGPVADDALLEAAYFKRYQRKWSEASQLFKRYLASYHDSRNPSVMWEVAWASYQSRDYTSAAVYLKKLAEREDMREKSLYWLGKSLSAAGDAKGAEAAFASLATEYPYGYYTLLCGRWCDLSQFPSAPRRLADALPMPAGFDREKALISLGLYDEAARELAAKKNKSPLAIAKLYLEMENFNGAYHIAAKLKPKRGDATVWGMTYPLAFEEEVTKNATANGVPESLVYAVMRAESNYHPGALSPVGAVGLMQVMPATADTIVKGDSNKLARPGSNIRLGSRHLKDLLALYDKNITLAVAAYNAGSGNVKRWQKGLGSLPQDEFVESIPFRETREYVKKVVTAMELYKRLYRLPPKNDPKVKSVATEAPKVQSVDTETPKAESIATEAPKVQGVATEAPKVQSGTTEDTGEHRGTPAQPSL